MTTKSKPSKVTKLSSTVYTAITAKTHSKHKRLLINEAYITVKVKEKIE